MARSDVNVTERNPSTHDPEKRSRKFTSVLLTGLFVVPAFGLLLRFIIFWAPEMLHLVAALSLLTGVAVAAIAVAIGYKVTKRVPFVVWHVAATAMLFGLALYTTTVVRWPAQTAPWYERLLAVINIPAWWVVVHLFGSVIVGGSWLLYRIDALRSAAGGNAEAGGGALAGLLSRMEGIRFRADQAVTDDVAVEVPVEHEGIPLSQVRSIVPALEETPGVIRGRSSVQQTDRGGHSILRIVHTDPHKTWRVWPGLSAPGGSYTEPIRTSYYSTGEVQWYSFVKTPDGMTFTPANPEDPNDTRAKFRSPNDSFKGAQGATGSGKSGGSAVEIAEVLSRNNVQVIYIDTAKLIQNAGWCLDFVSLAAGSRSASGALFTALRRVGELRTRILGEANQRNFTDEAARITGLSWIHIYADEFDAAKQNADMEWLATKGRSVGFRISYTLPRAVGDKLSTDIRAATGMWEQYGITQDYDKGFVLSDETIAAGANPESFGVSIPGAHYLDRAPGIEPRMWAIDCRVYKTREDYGDLRRAVEAARAAFTPPAWLPEELEALGEVARYCHPSIVRNGHIGLDTPPPAQPPTDAVQLNRQKGTDMQDTQPLPTDEDLEDAPYDAQLRSLIEDAEEGLDVSPEERQYGPLNPRVPDPMPTAEDNVQLAHVKPKPRDAAHAVAEFEAALIRMALKGVTEFGNGDVMAEMAVSMSPATISKRFTELCGGAQLEGPRSPGMVGNPPVVAVSRIEGSRGRFTLERLG